MHPYKAPVEDYLFLIHDVLRVAEHDLPGCEQFTGDVIEAMLNEAGRFAEEVLQPLNALGDKVGCIYSGDGTVTTPPGFKEAYRQVRDAGWNTLAAPVSAGGMGAPAILATAVEEFFNGANQSFAMYTGWGFYAGAMLENFGSDYLKQTYLPRIVSGEWNGAMGLTEAHCGTDLGLLRTSAKAEGDGSYRITGTKIFNSGGEHDLNENIIHFVLARLVDAPAGTAGISLFLAPKFVPDPETGALVRNAINCVGVEHKMGLRASATCTMQFNAARGWLIGEPHRGLAVMFVIMNHTRRSIGTCAVGVAEAAMQRAGAYAKERLQGRALSADLRGAGAADPLLVHPDVRRILLSGAAHIEAARALLLWTSLQIDIAERSPNAVDRRRAEALLGLMTPIAKAFVSDIGFETTVNAQQIFGGHGYITDNGMDQFVRDSRVLMLAEGANGVQAADLVLRKVRKDGGHAVEALTAEIAEFIDAHGASVNALALTRALKDLEQATRCVLEFDAEQAAGASYAYLHLLGMTSLGYMWLRIANAIETQKDAESSLRWRRKSAAARFFFEQILPVTSLHLERVKAGGEYVMRLPNEVF